MTIGKENTMRRVRMIRSSWKKGFGWGLLLLVLGGIGGKAAERAFPPDRPINQQQQYKRIHRQVAQWLFHGQPQKAVQWCEVFTKTNPKDAEGWYFYAGALAAVGRIPEAMEAVRRAEAVGLPLERFWAGPREAFRPLVTSEAFQKYAQSKVSPLIHGPMVGAVTATGAKIWVRTALPTKVVVEAYELSGNRTIRGEGKTSPQTDYTCVISLHGLRPNTKYAYTVKIGDRVVGSGQFRTRVLQGYPVKLRVAFGGGAGYTPWKEYIWKTILQRHPDAFLFLGDNVYIDAPEDRPYQRYKYYRRQSQPWFRQMVANTPIYAIYDDHDFGVNDCWGGPEVDRPAWKRQAWEVFCQNWVNPYYGGGQEHPGCWFHFSIGDVDFFLIDGRYYRTNPRTTPQAKRSMLGSYQKPWLLRHLQDSRATFKFLISDVPWASGTKPGSPDTWDGFDRERSEIFQFLAQHHITGVILLSADRHRHDIWQVRWPGKYPLYEFESSRLTNVHQHRCIPKALFCWNGNGFGELDIDTTQPDPVVCYRIMSIDGQCIHTFCLRLSQLQ